MGLSDNSYENASLSYYSYENAGLEREQMRVCLTILMGIQDGNVSKCGFT